jgi:hypothetical protein
MLSPKCSDEIYYQNDYYHLKDMILKQKKLLIKGNKKILME